MSKLFILGIILAIIIGVALMPYLKWVLLFLAVKVVLELIIKFKAIRTPKQKTNPLAFMQMGMSNIGNRIEQGFDTPKVKLSKVLMYFLGLIAVVVLGKVGIDLLLNFVYRFKYLLLLLLLIVALLLISKAKQGKPITMRKVVRHTSNIRPKRNHNQYDDEEEYSYNSGYQNNERYSCDRDMHRQEYDYDDSDDVCMYCRHRRYCDENKRRNCPEIRPRAGRNKRMDYI